MTPLAVAASPDPRTTKRWGFVSASPSEYLVHVRGGQVLPATSGQGATCFKRPGDAVAVVPTSLQRLAFRADQVTREKVGVEVAGLAVYRIAEPLLAYRVLDFAAPEAARRELDQTLTGMFVGAVRRLVATLTVEECLTRRKSALGEELLREIAPIVGGAGRPSDSTTRGWGIVIDTLEIQEVRVLSEHVFGALQAPYRAALDRAAREARAEAEQAVATREARARRETREAELEAEAAVRDRQVELERRHAEALAEEALRRLEREAREAAATVEVHASRLAALRATLEAREIEATATAAVRSRAAEVALVEGRGRAEVRLLEARAAAETSAAEARLVTARKLPELAAAVGGRIGEVKVTTLGGDNPFGSIAQAVAAVVDLARSA